MYRNWFGKHIFPFFFLSWFALVFIRLHCFVSINNPCNSLKRTAPTNMFNTIKKDSNTPIVVQGKGENWKKWMRVQTKKVIFFVASNITKNIRYMLNSCPRALLEQRILKIRHHKVVNEIRFATFHISIQIFCNSIWFVCVVWLLHTSVFQPLVWTIFVNTDPLWSFK